MIFISYIVRFTVKFVRVSDWTNDVCHSRSPPIFELKCEKKLSKYEIKTSYHGKCLNDFYSRVAMHQKLTRSPRSVVRFFDASQLVNKNHSCALSME